MSEFDVVMGMTTEEFARYQKWTQWLRLSVCSSLWTPKERVQAWIAEQRQAIRAFKLAAKRQRQAAAMRRWRTKRRGGRPSRKWFSWKGRESCAAGHRLMGMNVRHRRHRNGRVDMCCRICDNARQAAYRKRKAA